jgi:hypothetical protein
MLIFPNFISSILPVVIRAAPYTPTPARFIETSVSSSLAAGQFKFALGGSPSYAASPASSASAPG